MPTVVAILRPHPGMLDVLIDAYRQVAAEVHGEPGCVRYSAHVGKSELVMVESWRTAEDLAAHAAGEPVRRLTELREHALAERILHVLDEVAVPGAPQASLA